jgi:hypothetical protein
MQAGLCVLFACACGCSSDKTPGYQFPYSAGGAAGLTSDGAGLATSAGGAIPAFLNFGGSSGAPLNDDSISQTVPTTGCGQVVAQTPGLTMRSSNWDCAAISDSALHDVASRARNPDAPRTGALARC